MGIKKITPLKDNVLIKCVAKKTVIITSNDEKKPPINIEKVIVYSVGGDVKNLKVGDEVFVRDIDMNNPNYHVSIPIDKKDIKNDEQFFFLLMPEDVIVGKFN